ncbi:carboxymuconolactone decarboxylase family protein [Burkholderia plantarii]|uniref:carboxymuconolactone decarboxylase family protein n=1 Tax=Burkholderia plantarii TaxID=41899 RepID=UPI00114D0411|nr:carboxymuconolactone decarboxylase family protein [Burkholderia plantarii]
MATATYRDALPERLGDCAKLNPEAMRGLMTLDHVAAKLGRLEPKLHELIALAVAVTTRCAGCIALHVRQAVEHGASREEIAETRGVGIALDTGAALTCSARALEAHAALPGV